MYHYLWPIRVLIEGYSGVAVGMHYDSAFVAKLLRHFIKDSDRDIL